MRFFYLLIIYCWGQLCFAQKYGSYVNRFPVFVEEVQTNLLKENQLFIAMPFAKKLVLNPEQKKALEEKTIIKLELVYTQYRTSPSFNQKDLNTKRLVELNKLIPTIFNNPTWSFQLTCQTKAKNRREGEKMFHGFIVSFRPNSNKSTLISEAKYLDLLVKSMQKNDSIGKHPLPKDFTIKTRYDKVVGYIHDTIWFLDTVPTPNPPDFFYNQSLYQDSTVINTLERNKSWNNFIIVTDVTGSMSPYSAQVFVWLKKHIENKTAQYFVFFNDGDDKPSRKKVPLETKGIYTTENTGLDAVVNTASKCMRNGSGGGENLENDIEAILKGVNDYPNANEIILIADNLESMRDYKYLNQLKKPVHTILCGAEGRVNIQYLDLARQTKGSVHTKESDIFDLHKIKEGESLIIEDKEYLFKSGRFHFVY